MTRTPKPLALALGFLAAVAFLAAAFLAAVAFFALTSTPAMAQTRPQAPRRAPRTILSVTTSNAIVPTAPGSRLVVLHTGHWVRTAGNGHLRQRGRLSARQLRRLERAIRTAGFRIVPQPYMCDAVPSTNVHVSAGARQIGWMQPCGQRVDAGTERLLNLTHQLMPFDRPERVQPTLDSQPIVGS